MNRQFMNNMNYGYSNMQQPQYPIKPAIDGNNNIIWVDGEVGAKAYPVFNINSGVILMDNSEDNIVYLKITDGQGRATTTRYKLVEDELQTVQTNLSDYVRKDELQNLLLSIMTPSKEGNEDEQAISTVQPIIKKTITTAK